MYLVPKNRRSGKCDRVKGCEPGVSRGFSSLSHLGVRYRWSGRKAVAKNPQPFRARVSVVLRRDFATAFWACDRLRPLCDRSAFFNKTAIQSLFFVVCDRATAIWSNSLEKQLCVTNVLHLES